MGDTVLSRDQYDSDDDIESHLVTQVFRKTSDHLRILTIRSQDGNVEIIKTTDEHPFWVNGKGWTAAKELNNDDVLVKPNGSFSSLLASNKESHPEGIAVFYFEVEGDHTYFVEDGQGTADAVWVHNICVGDKFAVGNYKGRAFHYDVPATSKVFRLRTQADNKAMRDAIEAADGPREQFLKRMANDPAVQAKLSPANIQRLRDGQSPVGYDVHHRTPLKLGGDNAQGNLMLIQNGKAGGVDYHTPLTVEQNRLVGNLPDGEDTFETEWPDFGDRQFYP